MRLKTLRKEKPAFENEGVVISGRRIDLPNIGSQLLNYRTSNRLTSLNNDVPSLHHTQKMSTQSGRQTPSPSRFRLPSSAEATYLPSYQAIETACLEHGIRINVNQFADHSIGRNLTHTIQRPGGLIARKSSRPTTPLHYLTPSANHNSQPFTTLQRTSAADLEQIRTQNVSFPRADETDHPLQSSDQFYHNYCSSLSVTSEQLNQVTLPTQSDVSTDKPSLATAIGNDSDLAYMSSLLQRTSGASFQNTIRRRPALRIPPGTHRHPSLTTKIQSNQSDISSSTTTYSNPLVRHATFAVDPLTLTTSSSHKKLDKAILKHASRIRTNQMNNSLNHHPSFSKSHTNEDILPVSNSSPSRLSQPNKHNKTIKSSKSFSLEPLKLLLTPVSRPLPPLPPTHATSLSTNDFRGAKENNYQENKKRTNSHTIVSVDNHNQEQNDVTSLVTNEHLKPTLLNDESLSTLKTFATDMVSSEKIPQSSSFDSGCYDRSSNYSGDTQSATSLTITQAVSSVPSARRASVSTRRSHTTKKVSFEDPSLTVIITTSACI